MAFQVPPDGDLRVREHQSFLIDRFLVRDAGIKVRGVYRHGPCRQQPVAPVDHVGTRVHGGAVVAEGYRGVDGLLDLSGIQDVNDVVNTLIIEVGVQNQGISLCFAARCPVKLRCGKLAAPQVQVACFELPKAVAQRPSCGQCKGKGDVRHPAGHGYRYGGGYLQVEKAYFPSHGQAVA